MIPTEDKVECLAKNESWIAKKKVRKPVGSNSTPTRGCYAVLIIRVIRMGTYLQGG